MISGKASGMPATQRKSVVLPDPFGPIKTIACPGVSSNDKSLNKRRLPLLWVKFVTLRRGGVIMRVTITNFPGGVNYGGKGRVGWTQGVFLNCPLPKPIYARFFAILLAGLAPITFLF